MNMKKTKIKGHWNYRVLRFITGEGEDREESYQVHSVYYTNEVPDGYGETGAVVYGSTMDELKADLERFKRAIYEMPVIDGDNFPNEIT